MVSAQRSAKHVSKTAVPIDTILALESDALNMDNERLNLVKKQYEEHVKTIMAAVSSWMKSDNESRSSKNKVVSPINEVNEAELFGFLSEVFYEQMKFKGTSATLLVTSVMSGKFNCYSSTIILGDALMRLGKPLKFIITPGHVLASGTEYAFETTATNPELAFLPRGMLKERYPTRQEGETGMLLSAANIWCGTVFGRTGRFRQALDSCKKAVELTPQSPTAWSKLGNALKSRGLSDDALYAYETAIQFKKDFVPAWNGKGNVLVGMGKLEEALYAYEMAIDSDAGLPTPWHNKGIILKSMKRYAEALDALENAVRLSPTNAVSWFNKGTILDHMGKHDDANSAYDMAVKLAPHDADYLQNRIQILREELRKQDLLRRDKSE